MSSPDVVGEVVSLHIYPIKGCRAINLNTVVATPKGFGYDRHWVIVSAHSHRYMTQRNCQELATVTPELPRSVLEGSPPQRDMNLVIRLPNQLQPIKVPLINPEPRFKKISVAEWNGCAQDEGDEVASKLTNFLRVPVRLFRYISNPDDRKRLKHEVVSIPVDSTFAQGYDTTFTDGFPYLVVNEASLRDVQEKAPDSVIEIDRFRANIVIRAQNPWEEDEWRQIQTVARDGMGDGPMFRFVKPCQRCKCTCVHQTTGDPQVQPLDILQRIRTGTETGFSNYLKGMEKRGFFGWNAVCSNTKRISVSDLVFLTNQGPWKCEVPWSEKAYSTVKWAWSTLTGM